MMPRSRPPTAHFVPRSSGRSACSTDTKNASASRWTMVGSSMAERLKKMPRRKDPIKDRIGWP